MGVKEAKNLVRMEPHTYSLSHLSLTNDAPPTLHRGLNERKGGAPINFLSSHTTRGDEVSFS
jgi:hypothetical protein